MSEVETMLQALANQEETYQFDTFSADMALAIGLDIIEAARAKGQSIAVDITRQGLQLFRFSMTGTTNNHTDWIRRKSNTVLKLGHSSLYLHTYLRMQKKTITEEYGLPSVDYAAEGGAFPILTKEEGIIGTITVSGLAGEDDHACVIAALQKYLQPNH